MGEVGLSIRMEVSLAQILPMITGKDSKDQQVLSGLLGSNLCLNKTPGPEAELESHHRWASSWAWRPQLDAL